MKVYILNESGVFENPEILEYEIKNIPAVKIKTAFANNKWYMGIDIITSTQGLGLPVHISKHSFINQETAIEEGKKFAINYLTNMLNDEYCVGKDKIKSLLKILSEKQRPKQLELL